MRKNSRGFTLIELMIVVIVVSILAAIAIPSYLEQSRKGRRADAVRAVGDLQLALERWRAENPSYADCTACGSGTYPTVPTSPYYTIGITGANATSYTITATRKSGSAQAEDRCGNLSATQDLQAKPSWSGEADCNQ